MFERTSNRGGLTVCMSVLFPPRYRRPRWPARRSATSSSATDSTSPKQIQSASARSSSGIPWVNGPPTANGFSCAFAFSTHRA